MSLKRMERKIEPALRVFYFFVASTYQSTPVFSYLFFLNNQYTVFGINPCLCKIYPLDIFNTWKMMVDKFQMSLKISDSVLIYNRKMRHQVLAFRSPNFQTGSRDMSCPTVIIYWTCAITTRPASKQCTQSVTRLPKNGSPETKKLLTKMSMKKKKKTEKSE